jgi:hypothetical protein
MFALRHLGLSFVAAMLVVACSSGSDSLYTGRTRTDNATKESTTDKDDPNPRPDPPSSNSGSSGSSSAPPPPASTTDAGSGTPPVTAPEGSCFNPKCFGVAGVCGCQGGDAVMGCENGQCACGDLVFDDSGGCGGLLADKETLKALFTGCICNDK